MKASDRDNIQILTVIMKNTSPPEPQFNSLAKEFGLPMKVIRDVRQLERSLKEQDNRRKLLSFISGIGGSACSVVGRILRKLMTYTL